MKPVISIVNNRLLEERWFKRFCNTAIAKYFSLFWAFP
jgi:hypothetical protein